MIFVIFFDCGNFFIYVRASFVEVFADSDRDGLESHNVQRSDPHTRRRLTPVMDADRLPLKIAQLSCVTFAS